MNTKVITSIAIFAALAVVLSQIVVPAPYLPILFYEIWEIPIVSALLLLGVKPCFLILALETLVALIFFPAWSNPGLNPIFGFVACSSMLSGVFVGSKFAKGIKRSHFSSKAQLMIFSGIGIAFRVLSMTFFVYFVFVGLIGVPSSLIVATLPLVGLFNVTLPLYTIPLGLIIAKIINKSLLHNF